MATKFDLPPDAHLAEKIIDGEHGHRSRLTEMGIFGRLFGGGLEKPGNVAGFAIIASFVFLAVVLIWGPDSTVFPKKELVTLFGSIITGSLGFLFGRSTG
jgi:hypothetical protein